MWLAKKIESANSLLFSPAGVCAFLLIFQGSELQVPEAPTKDLQSRYLNTNKNNFQGRIPKDSQRIHITSTFLSNFLFRRLQTQNPKTPTPAPSAERANTYSGVSWSQAGVWANKLLVGHKMKNFSDFGALVGITLFSFCWLPIFAKSF